MNKLVIFALFSSACGSTPASIAIGAAIDGATWECDGSYADVGTTTGEVKAKDLRFYLHNVKIDGAAVTLSQNDYQKDGLALIDLENGCGSGNATLHNTLDIEDAPAAATTLSFTLGIPFDKNHQDVAAAEAPLDDPSLFWNWNGGYKFLRADFESAEGTPWNFHLGSTGCDADADGVITGCAKENLFDYSVTIQSLDDVIVFDLGTVLKDSDLGSNTAETPPGCLSGPADPECAPIFDNLANLVGVR